MQTNIRIPNALQLSIKVDHEDYIPTKAHASDAGYDLRVRIPSTTQDSLDILRLYFLGNVYNEIYTPKLFVNKTAIDIEKILKFARDLYSYLDTTANTDVADTMCLEFISKYTNGANFTIIPGGQLYAHWQYAMAMYNNRALIGTGVYLQTPERYVTHPGIPFHMVAPRSGLSFHTGLGLVNSMGIIDQEYTGELKLTFENRSKDFIILTDKARAAQLIPMVTVATNHRLNVIDSVNDSARGSNGFGSSGV